GSGSGLCCARRRVLRAAAPMNHFHYRRGILCAESVPLTRIAGAVGTPTYVYSTATLTRHFRVLSETFRGEPHLLCYSVKASSNLSLLRLFSRLGFGFDIVSGGELHRALKAGAEPAKIVFSGVGKTAAEMERALGVGILLFNVESSEELQALDDVVRRLKRRAPVTVPLNPDVDARPCRSFSTGLPRSRL